MYVRGAERELKTRLWSRVKDPLSAFLIPLLAACVGPPLSAGSPLHIESELLVSFLSQ